MYQSKYQTPTESLPTMYDLPSEDPEEPGLPDLFHDYQPKLLRETCKPATYPSDQVFIACDLNLYYDARHTLWHKRPDWFMCLGVTSGTKQEDLRWSYVIWHEEVAPYLVVELLSPGTEDEDLGRLVRLTDKQPPLKWEVYEEILAVPFYVVYDRYENDLRVFERRDGRYQLVDLPEPRYWFTELQVGVGVWEGSYGGAHGLWLRWYDASGQWILTEAEGRAAAEEMAAREMQRADEALKQMNEEAARADEALQRASEEADRADRLAAQLRALGIDPDA